MLQNIVTNGPEYVVIAERRQRPTSKPEITTTKHFTRRIAARSMLACLLVGARQRGLPVVADGEEITFQERHGSETSVTAYIKQVF